MMPFTVLRRFSGSDSLRPGLEKQDRPALQARPVLNTWLFMV